MANTYSPRKPIENKIFGRLTVLHLTEIRKRPDGNRRYLYACKCACGKGANVDRCHLVSGHTISCGCLVSETIIRLSTTHGLKGSPIYNIWKRMRSRCHNAKDASYKRYGGRGISVCPEWENFKVFHYDMISSYAPGLSIDRIKNSLGYSKANCRWATAKEQARNTRGNVWVTINGMTETLSYWTIKLGISFQGFYNRKRKGLTDLEALTKPKGKRYSLQPNLRKTPLGSVSEI